MSSICIPIVLGSNVISTPAPNLPTDVQETRRNTNNKLIDGHHRYEAVKDKCTEIDVYIVNSKYMERFLSTLNSYLWFDTLEKLKDY